MRREILCTVVAAALELGAIACGTGVTTSVEITNITDKPLPISRYASLPPHGETLGEIPPRGTETAICKINDKDGTPEILRIQIDGSVGYIAFHGAGGLPQISPGTDALSTLFDCKDLDAPTNNYH